MMQGMSYLIKLKANEKDNLLILEAWKSISIPVSDHKEGISFHNFLMFLLVINNIYPEEEMKLESLEQQSTNQDQLKGAKVEEHRPFGCVIQGRFCVTSVIESQKIHQKYLSFIINKNTIQHNLKYENIQRIQKKES